MPWNPGPGPTAGDDVFIGTDAADSADGGAGNDILYGGFTSDRFSNDSAVDVLSGGLGNDTVYAGLGDQVDGGAGTQDRISVNFGLRGSALTLSLGATPQVNLAAASGGSITGFELFTIVGTPFADTLEGGAGADTISGGAGNDLVRGLGNFDVLYGGLGEDVIESGDGGGSLWHGANELSGLAHDDGAVDTLIGGAGSENLYVGLNDVVDGHGGYDLVYVSLHALTAGVTLDLSVDRRGALEAISGTTLNNVEEYNVFGTQYDDQLFGSASPERLFGGAGENLIRGGAGNDILSGQYADDVLEGEGGVDLFYYVGGADIMSGGDGADTFQYGSSFLADPIVAGNATLDGDDGDDRIDFARLTTGLTVDLAVQTPRNIGFGTVTILSVERLQGSSANDVFSGGAANETLSGGGGADVIRGRGGLDVLDGGAGADTLDYRDKSAAVVLTLAGAADAIVTVGGVAEDTVRGFETVFGGSAGDTLTGDALANSFRGGGGNDLINGFGGVDTIDFRDKTVAVVLTLAGSANAVATVGGAAQDTVRNVENILGGTAGDKLAGDTLANRLTGGAGGDELKGGGGADVFVYTALGDSTLAVAGRDKIVDFSRAQGDRIDLSAIDAVAGGADNAFVIGSLGTAGRLQVTTVTPGSVYLIQGDVNGGGADFAIVVNHASLLVASDFVL